MTLVRRVNHPFYSLFNDFFNDEIDRGFAASKNITPAVNVKEKETEFEVELVAPGYNKNDFNLKLNKDQLTISSETKEASEENEGEKIIRREYKSSAFSRSFTLPQNVDIEKIEAKYENGLLKVVIPKLEKVNHDGSREIAIG
ncbi:MAG: Hsp20/alpha crystallin family protein [Bacteroidia bacterium]